MRFSRRRSRSYNRYSRWVCPDTTPIKTAFAELRRAGYISRMNFSCCSSCGWYEIGQMPKKAKSKGIVFYNRQSTETLSRTGRTMLQWEGDSKFICTVLEKHGIKTKHNGTENQCIEIAVGVDFPPEPPVYDLPHPMNSGAVLWC
jgi:hypothetical protein